MKFTISYIPYSQLISNMKKYEVDVFNYVRKMIEADILGNYRLASTYENECHGYIVCLFANDIIDSDTFDLLSKYLSHSRYV